MKLLNTAGYLCNTSIEGRNYPYRYDGYRLDELVLNTIMTSQEDVEKIIRFLTIHKWCFDKTETKVTYNEELPPAQ